MSFGSKKLSGLLLIAASASAYTWPDPQLDELESLVYDQHGFNSRGILAGALDPCSRFNFGSTVNRSNVADWIRTAYHDMATHNVEDGTGGLDASIQFEQDRAENAGDGFFNSIRHLSLGITRYAGVADLIALGAKTAIEQCGGPKVPFRGGRVDATVPNNPGVPEPQQGLDSHIAAFARQGFTQTEMITLVACGHSFGGVQHSAFPDTVPLPDGVDDVSQTFDSTPFNFDNAIAFEYVHGTTNNPLIVGHNDTTNSDKRIFGSDGNATMASFAASPDLFKSTCGTLFARMLDTVPKDVQLTEVIEPLPVKPQTMLLTYMGDGTLKLSGQVRFWDTAESTSRSAKIVWADRAGKTDTSYTDVLSTNADMVASALNGGNFSVLWYNVGPIDKNFSVLEETAGISKFWFEIDEGDGSGVRTEDQNGVGFVLQDSVMLADSSCEITSSSGSSSNATIDIAVRADIQPSRVYIEYDLFNTAPSGGSYTTVNTTDAQPASGPSKRASSAYNIWTLQLSDSILTLSLPRTINIAVDAGDRKITTASFAPFSLLAGKQCK
ncbi:heme peroxidase [Lentinus tigrinus ALCF2SS1-7]|uniref:Peroxidase n=1 Tax=Lentinus tigrinus ALCF2SS1-6 TaxID=1328759 RepID=A0A5C2RYQ7_9APHY|nr:heme peroxidase [Lentinus tigrinus ALCF2SS1-6]RPD73982.1 heme peroxidase [Lentinus tigrinus ALCF2SS1-7]